MNQNQESEEAKNQTNKAVKKLNFNASVFIQQDTAAGQLFSQSLPQQKQIHIQNLISPQQPQQQEKNMQKILETQEQQQKMINASDNQNLGIVAFNKQQHQHQPSQQQHQNMQAIQAQQNLHATDKQTIQQKQEVPAISKAAAKKTTKLMNPQTVNYIPNVEAQLLQQPIQQQSPFPHENPDHQIAQPQHQQQTQQHYQQAILEQSGNIQNMVSSQNTSTTTQEKPAKKQMKTISEQFSPPMVVSDQVSNQVAQTQIKDVHSQAIISQPIKECDGTVKDIKEIHHQDKQESSQPQLQPEQKQQIQESQQQTNQNQNQNQTNQTNQKQKQKRVDAQLLLNRILDKRAKLAASADGWDEKNKIPMLSQTVIQCIRDIYQREVRVESRQQKTMSTPQPFKKDFCRSNMPSGGGNSFQQGGFAQQQQQQQAQALQVMHNLSAGPSRNMQPMDPLLLSLKTSSNRWVQMNKNEQAGQPQQKVMKQMKMSLNILAPDNFDKVKVELMDLAKTDLHTCKLLVDLIIEKSWTELKYTTLYTKLCQFLAKQSELYLEDQQQQKQDLQQQNSDVQLEQSSQLTVTQPTVVVAQPQPGQKRGANSFKRHLMSRIQTAFEEEKVQKETKVKKQEAAITLENEKQDQLQKEKKKRILGNVNFIGELFLSGVVNNMIIQICTWQLFSKFYKDLYAFAVQKNPQHRNYIDSIDGIIVLYDKIGFKIDVRQQSESQNQQAQSSTAQSAQETSKLGHFKELIEQIANYVQEGKDGNTNCAQPAQDSEMAQYSDFQISMQGLFELLEFLNKGKNKQLIETRVQCLLKNLRERRSQQWKVAITKEKGPTKVAEVHKEFEEEKQAVERRAAQYYADVNNDQYGRGSNSPVQVKQFYVQKSISKPTSASVQTVVYGEKTAETQSPRKIDMQGTESYPLNFSKSTVSSIKATSSHISSFDNNSHAANSNMQNQQHANANSKQPQISFHDVEKQLKDSFQFLDANKKRCEGEDNEQADQETPYHENEFYNDMCQILKRANSKVFIDTFLKTFYDGKIINVKNRLFVPFRLYKQGLLPLDEFTNEFISFLKKASDIVEDFPDLLNSLSKIYEQFVINGALKYNYLINSKESQDHKEEHEELMKNFIICAIKNLRSQELLETYKDQFIQFLANINLLDPKKEYEALVSQSLD